MTASEITREVTSEIKLLIVEDELLIAETLSRKLKKLGYTVVDIVSSGEDAITRALQTQPDLILMDIVIEGEMDGIETAAKITSQMDIPIIYTTAYADDDTLQRAEGTGSYGYVLKPFKERELHASIKIALKQHQQVLQIEEDLAMARTSNHNKTRYISMASHDLRTPLTTIQLSTELLQNNQQQWSPETQAKNFDRIKRAVKNMSQILDEVLMLSKAESGQLVFRPETFDIVNFCQSLLEQFQPHISSKHSLSFQHIGNDGQVTLDKILLRHILMNVLSNAIKYSPEGGLIRLEVRSEEKGVKFIIEDEGIGIPDEFHRYLFKQFERASNVGNIQGTGLGLAIVKHCVDLHRGTIALQSQSGKGTKITLFLPQISSP